MLRKIPLISLLTLIIGLPLQLCGAAELPLLRPINQHYYRTPATIQPGPSKIFWLKTPHNDEVLIELNYTKESTPKIAMDGSANFHYISADIRPYSDLHIIVPAGLYYWKKQAAVKVRPTDPDSYRYSPQTNEFIHAQLETAFDPFSEPEVFEKFAKRTRFTTRYIRNPIENPWHPFDQQWGKTLTTDVGQAVHHAAMALPPFKGAPPPQPKERINIASSNVLSQALYETWFNQNINFKAYSLPLVDRQALFDAAFQDPSQLADKDFIMVQEHAHGQVPGGLHTPKGTNYYSLKYGLLRDKVITDIVYKTGSADLYYNSKKFIPKRAIFDPTISKKIANGRHLGAVFEFIDHPGRYIGVVSAHIQWGKPEQVQKLLADIDAVAQWYPKMGWIIAGDFNMNYNHPQSQSTQEKLGYIKGAGFIDSGVGTIHQKRFTALGKVLKEAPFDYITLIEGIDYIFYKNLHLIHTNTYPRANQFADRLLTSGHPWSDGTPTTDRDRTFYSDHAIIGAEFVPIVAQPVPIAAKQHIPQPQLQQAPAEKPVAAQPPVHVPAKKQIPQPQPPVKKESKAADYPLFDIFGLID